jgi:DNA-binding XRE family transcriptional regulator
MARAGKGWTLKTAAQRCGVSISTIWAMENGTRCPSVSIAGDVAKGYGLSTDDTVDLMSEALRNVGRDNPGKAKAAA